MRRLEELWCLPLTSTALVSCFAVLFGWNTFYFYSISQAHSKSLKLTWGLVMERSLPKGGCEFWNLSSLAPEKPGLCCSCCLASCCLPRGDLRDGLRMPGPVVHTHDPAHEMLKLGIGESMASLGYIAIVSSPRWEGGSSWMVTGTVSALSVVGVCWLSLGQLRRSKSGAQPSLRLSV